MVNRIAIDMSPVVYGARAVKRCTKCMVKELIKNENIQFDLIYIDYRKQTEKYLKTSGTRVKESVIPIPYKLLIPLWKKFAWPRFDTRFSKSALFYTNEFYFPPSKKTIILATVHGLAYQVIPEKIPLHVAESLNQGLSFMLKHADYLVAVSETTKKELVRYSNVDPQRIYVVTHGVDRQFRQLAKQKEIQHRLKSIYGLSDPYLLYVGAIGMHKNIMGILAAYEKLSLETPHHLVLAGPADSAWEIAKQFVVEKKLSEKIHFLGHVYDTDKLVDLYNGADLFVFPSYYEGWTSPPLEAMACGTPVITSNSSSLPETVGDAAVKIDPENISELSQAMKTVLKDQSLRNELINKGLAHAAIHTWERAAQNLLAVFGEVQSRGPWNKTKE